jgi:hypothetical protein
MKYVKDSEWSHLKQAYSRRFVAFEVLTEAVMDVAISWDILSCSPYMNRRFGGKYYFRLQGKKQAEQETSV